MQRCNVGNEKGGVMETQKSHVTWAYLLLRYLTLANTNVTPADSLT